MKTVVVILCLATLLSCTNKTQRSKKVFHSFRSEVFKTLDPPRQFDNASSDMVINIYDTLLEYDRFKRPYELSPVLLTRMPEVEKDGLSYLFTLKKGVYFHDDPAFPDGKGKELTADDAIFTIKRFADARVNVLSFSLLHGLITGLDDFRDRSAQDPKFDADAAQVAGLVKVDSHRFIIRFTVKSPLVFHVFSFTGLSIVSKDIVQHYGKDFPSHPVGTGPFYVKSYEPNGNFILAKHGLYHQAYPDAPGKMMPFVDEVHLPLIEESKEVSAKFRKNELDIMGLSTDMFDEVAYKDDDGRFYLKRKYADQYTLYYETMPSVSYIKFNMEDKLIGKNKKLRQALAYAIDSVNAIDLLMNGRGVMLDSIVPPSINGSASLIASSKWHRQNLRKASELLKEAGYPRGKGLPEIVMEFNSTSRESRQSYEFIRNEYAKIGVNLKGNFQTFAQFLEKVESGTFQVASGGWVADYPDAENFYALLYGKNKAPGPNDGNFDNPEYDRLYEKIRFMPNGEERYKLFAKMNDIILDECPVILQEAPITVGLLQKSVRNFKLNGLTGTSYKYLDLQEN